MAWLLGARRENPPAGAGAGIQRRSSAFADRPRRRSQLRRRPARVIAASAGAIASLAFVGFSDRLLAATLLAKVEVERVVAVVNRTPILASDVEIVELAGLVPRSPGESDGTHHDAVREALIALSLRWQDLDRTGLAARIRPDLDASWASVVARAGGAEILLQRLAAAGLSEALLRELVRRMATVEAYAAERFGPFVRPSPQEVEAAYATELVPALAARGSASPPLDEVRGQLEELVRERKLAAEIERWTAELAARARIRRYSSR